jgi:hypothetical protein
MSVLNIFVCIEFDLICSRSTKGERTTALPRISHLSIKHEIHGVFLLDYKKR